MTSFSLLPLELKEEIASFLSFQEITSLCCVEKALYGIYSDKGFWRSLIIKRFPKHQQNPQAVDNPKIFLYKLERNMCHITLTPPDKKPLSLTTNNKDIIAAIIIIAYLNYCTKAKLRFNEFYLVDELKIIKPDGESLTLFETKAIIDENKTRAGLLLQSKSHHQKIIFVVQDKSSERYSSYINILENIPISLHFPDSTFPDVIKHIIMFLEYIEAKNISIQHIIP